MKRQSGLGRGRPTAGETCVATGAERSAHGAARNARDGRDAATPKPSDRDDTAPDGSSARETSLDTHTTYIYRRISEYKLVSFYPLNSNLLI